MCWPHVMQVLRNPTTHLQEGPGITEAQLAAKGIKPYDTQVRDPKLDSEPSTIAKR